MTRTASFQYRLPRPAVGVYPGAHPGQMVGNGQLFKRHEPLIARPDPRRIDLRASLLDPFGAFQVRVHQQHSRAEVYLLADLSTSMSFKGSLAKRSTLIAMLESIALSAQEYADNFGFIAYAEHVVKSLYLPASKHQGRIQALGEKLKSWRFTPGSNGLNEVHAYLPGHRALLFLVSDFHMPMHLLKQALQSLMRHDVVPLVLWDAQEYRQLPDWGLYYLQDLETGRRRTLWMRPSLKRRIQQVYAARRLELEACFRGFGCEPVFIEDGYHAEQLELYFLQRAA